MLKKTHTYILCVKNTTLLSLANNSTKLSRIKYSDVTQVSVQYPPAEEKKPDMKLFNGKDIQVRGDYQAQFADPVWISY